MGRRGVYLEAPQWLGAADGSCSARLLIRETGAQNGCRYRDIPHCGWRGSHLRTNETIFNLAERPRHLIIIGAGPIGLEMAQGFRRLGSAVTVLEAASPARQGRSGSSGYRSHSARARRRRHKKRCEGDACRLHRPQRDGDVRRAPTARKSRRQSSAGRCRAQAFARGARSRRRRHSPRPHRHFRQPQAQDRQPPRLCDRRCRRRAIAVHPRRQLSRRPGDPERAVPAAGAREQRRRAVGDLHRSRIGAGRADRGGTRARAPSRSAFCAGPITTTTAPRPSA